MCVNWLLVVVICMFCLLFVCGLVIVDRCLWLCCRLSLFVFFCCLLWLCCSLLRVRCCSPCFFRCLLFVGCCLLFVGGLGFCLLLFSSFVVVC